VRVELEFAIDYLAERLQQRELVIFLGPDLPRALAGAPGWPELAAALAERGGWPAGEWPAAATRYEQAAGRWNLEMWLRQRLVGSEPGPLYLAAASLPVATYLGAAYDDLLRKALAAAGRRPNLVVSADDLSFLRPGRPTVVKLLGDLGPGRRQELLLTQQDLAALLPERIRSLGSALRPAFATSSLLVVGQDLQAGWFDRLMADQTLAAGDPRYARRAYAVGPGLEAWQVEAWGARGLTVLDADPLDLLRRLQPAGA
jgi:hypothetical protein